MQLFVKGDRGDVRSRFVGILEEVEVRRHENPYRSLAIFSVLS